MRLNADVPAELERIISKCLEKDRNLRYQHASDVRTDLQRLKRDTESGKTAAVPGGGTCHSEKTNALGCWSNGGDCSRRHHRFLLFPPSSRAHRKDTIVLADFANSTGDAVFADTLRTALSVALNQSAFLNVLSENKVAATLKLMSRPAGAKLTPEVARELCQRTGSKAYIAESIASLGSQYVLGLKAVNCQSGDPLAEQQVAASSKEKVLDAVGEASSKLRTELGESLATVQKFDVPLEQATTSSLEALKGYSLGLKAANGKGTAAALPYFQRAIELDPNFATGYNVVGDDYISLGE